MKMLKLGYWDARGVAEPIRKLLHYAAIPFEDVRYGFQVGNVFPTKELWLKEKFTLGLHFPNLPYLIDGDLKLTQSLAILKHLARKCALISETPIELALEEMIEEQILDILKKLIMAVYHKSYKTPTEFKSEMDSVVQCLHLSLGQLELWIGEKKWLVHSDKLCYVDFMAYEYLDWHREFVQPECFERYPKMTAYMERFEELEPLKEYLASEQYRNTSCLSPYAKLGYRFAKNVTSTVKCFC